MARASSSLPVPLSPVISTRASVPATMCAWPSRSSISALRETMPVRQSSATSLKPEILSAFCTCASSSVFSTGLVRKPNAPICVACTASGMVPWAVSRMTLRPGQRACSSLSRPMPSIGSMRRSLMTRSGRKRLAAVMASGAFSTASTS
jgi:hypothetical protein